MIRVFRFLAYAIGIVVLAGCIPLGYFVGVGLYRGYDVGAGLKSLFYRPQGTTIDPDKVPRRMHEVVWTGDVENHLLSEASGLAQSSVDPTLFFSINDSGNGPDVFALRNDGSDLGFWVVDVSRNVDWEDIASFTLDGEHYLLIADTGDNFRWRPVLNLYVVKEPAVDEMSMDEKLPVAWSLRFRYPKGYRDCEAVAVDEKERVIYLVSKRTVPAEVYRLPLKPGGRGVLTATHVASLNTIPQPDEQDLWEEPSDGAYRSMPTAMDIRGDKAVVVTYKDAYLFERRGRQSWPEAFGEIPERIALPHVPSRESGLVTRDEQYLYVTSERESGTNRTGLFRIRL